MKMKDNEFLFNFLKFKYGMTETQFRRIVPLVEEIESRSKRLAALLEKMTGKEFDGTVIIIHEPSEEEKERADLEGPWSMGFLRDEKIKWREEFGSPFTGEKQPKRRNPKGY